MRQARARIVYGNKKAGIAPLRHRCVQGAEVGFILGFQNLDGHLVRLQAGGGAHFQRPFCRVAVA